MEVTQGDSPWRRVRRRIRRSASTLLAFAMLTGVLNLAALPASAADLPTKEQIKAAVASEPGGNVFWTGRVNSCASQDDSVEGIAERFARERGQSSLEMRLAAAGVTMPGFDARDDASVAIWEYASDEFARQTADQAWVVKGTCIRDGNVWESKELPMLMKSGKVKCIWQVDANDLAHETLLWSDWTWGSTCQDAVDRRNKATMACIQWNDPGSRWGSGEGRIIGKYYTQNWLYYGGKRFTGAVPRGFPEGTQGFVYSTEPADSSKPPADEGGWIDQHDRIVGWFTPSLGMHTPYRLQIVRGGQQSPDERVYTLDQMCSFKAPVFFSEEEVPDPGVPSQRVAYFPSWSVYGNKFYVKDLDTRGIAGKLTYLNYAFENIDPVNLTCLAANKSGSSNDSDTTGNDGASDAWADYQMGFDSENSVNGLTDYWSQPLKGNFNQLKQLKAKYPHLKVLVSLGGWTYSKYFSDVAATRDSRYKFVKSCIDMYINGNLPVLDGSPAGGRGAAAGVFDGFDIDWEFPGSANGHSGNHYSAIDGENYILLLQEFRRQLNQLDGDKRYSLTAALPAGANEIEQLEAPESGIKELGNTLDLGNIMTYDMHGAWERYGPTNFQAPLFDSSRSPAYGKGLTVNDVVVRYLMGGFGGNKLVVGVPFYARGWTSVPDNDTHGLYQPGLAPTATFPYSQQPGVAMYKELKAAGKLDNPQWDPETQSSYVYDGNDFWSIETPESLRAKRKFIKAKGLGGVMMYSLEADDADSTLLKAATGLEADGPITEQPPSDNG